MKNICEPMLPSASSKVESVPENPEGLKVHPGWAFWCGALMRSSVNARWLGALTWAPYGAPSLSAPMDITTATSTESSAVSLPNWIQALMDTDSWTPGWPPLMPPLVRKIDYEVKEQQGLTEGGTANKDWTICKNLPCFLFYDYLTQSIASCLDKGLFCARHGGNFLDLPDSSAVIGLPEFQESSKLQVSLST